MEKASAPTLHPAMLPPGTQVGPWRVVAWAGRGVYGAVYRAVSVQDEHAAPVALKLALLPRDPRFVREVELLSRLSHPSAPRLVGHGEWQHPGGTLYPFIAMEWVDGVPLYDWAKLHPPASQQVLRWLAQLARVLQALHSQGAVHRDVKGDNVLVRRSDSRALLTDFGSGIYPGATTLTPPTLTLRHAIPPGRQMISTRWVSPPAGSSPVSTRSSLNPPRMSTASGTWRPCLLLPPCSTRSRGFVT
jgi:serine/threonine protein kinase